MKIIKRTLGTLVLMLAFAGPASAFTADKCRIVLDITLAGGPGSNVFVRVNEKKQTINVRGFVTDQLFLATVKRTAKSYGAKDVSFQLWFTS